MSRQKPTKDASHNNDGIGLYNLKNAFSNWNINSIKDVHSGIEYGQDWIVDIVDEDDTVTGMEFRVQSKVLSAKTALRKDSIGDNIKISTINYLFDLVVPVLLHFVDKLSGIGYVMWLEPWYHNQDRSSWESQKTVRINIPLANELTPEYALELKKEVAKQFKRSDLRKKVDWVNDTSSDLKIDLNFEGNDTFLTINPKHQEAIPITPLDDESKVAFQQALDRGEATPLTGKIGLPNNLLGVMESAPPGQLTVIPKPRDAPILVNFIFLDEKDEILYSIRFVDMKLVNDGNVIKRWAGSAHQGAFLFDLEFNISTKQNSMTLQVGQGENPPINIAQYFDYFSSLKDTKIIQAIEARSEGSVRDSV